MSKFAIIGYGKMGKYYDKAISADYIVDVVSIANKAYFRSVEDFVSMHPAVDLVIVSTPSETHFSIAKTLLESDYNVLVEKPICLSVNKSLNLENLAEERGKILYQSTLERYNPVVSFIKKNVDLSHVSKIRSSRFGFQPNRANLEGPVFDLGIHEVDLYFYLVSGKNIPWDIEVGYSSDPKRELLLYMSTGEIVRCDLMNKYITRDNLKLDLNLSNQNNPMLQMVQEILYKGPNINEIWSNEIKILEKFNNNKIQL